LYLSYSFIQKNREINPFAHNFTKPIIMTALNFITAKIRKTIIHLIVLAIAIKLLSFTFIEFPEMRWNGYTVLTVILAFYMHSLLLLPILIRKKKIRTYMLWTALCFIVFASAMHWFEALRSSAVANILEGTSSDPNSGVARILEGMSTDPMDMFLNSKYIIRHFLFFLLTSVPLGLLSLIYYLLITDKKHRTAFFAFKYTELIVNVIVVGALVLFIVFNMYRAPGLLITILILSLLILCFYSNAFFVTPVLLKEKNLGKYVLLVGLLFFVYVNGIQWVFQIFHYEAGPFSNVIVLSFGILVVFIFSFIYGYIRIKLKAKEQLFNLKLEAKESELQLLKSQVNPHFLFNTLNTLYATALEEGASKTAESTAKLASLIRYMQEDINKDFIPLEKEIKYLQDYITIQELRFAVPPEIETVFKNIKDHSISPGLLIPFVENAFKYGIDPSKPSKLKVYINCDENRIKFECINSYDDNFKSYYKEQGFGIGIKNAIQRLELVYPKKHTFSVLKEERTFSVKMSINIENI